MDADKYGGIHTCDPGVKPSEVFEGLLARMELLAENAVYKQRSRSLKGGGWHTRA